MGQDKCSEVVFYFNFLEETTLRQNKNMNNKMKRNYTERPYNKYNGKITKFSIRKEKKQN